MIRTNLKQRTKDFAIRVIKVCKALRKEEWMEVILGKQLLRSGTSAAANYRATVIAKSEKDFINKLKIVEEELDETIFWMEILVESEVIPKSKLSLLIKEAEELLRIISASIITMKKKRKSGKNKDVLNSN
jgi:four helix bundle protein